MPFNLATNSADFGCLWSPDSKLVAIYERGSKRSGDTSLYLLSGENGDKVKELEFPELMPLIKPHLTSELLALHVRPEAWIKDRQLVLSVNLTQTADTASRFILTMKMPEVDAPKPVVALVSFQEDRSLDIPGK